MNIHVGMLGRVEELGFFLLPRYRFNPSLGPSRLSGYTAFVVGRNLSIKRLDLPKHARLRTLSCSKHADVPRYTFTRVPGRYKIELAVQVGPLDCTAT